MLGRELKADDRGGQRWQYGRREETRWDSRIFFFFPEGGSNSGGMLWARLRLALMVVYGWSRSIAVALPRLGLGVPTVFPLYSRSVADEATSP